MYHDEQQAMYSRHTESLLEDINETLEDDYTNDELEFILAVMKNTKEYLQVLESLKPFLK